MKKIAVITGILLIIIGLVGYGMPQEIVTDGPDGATIETHRSWTALIPLFFGLPILLCGLVAWLKPDSNKMAMHIAASFGLLGAVAASARGGSTMLKWVRAEGEVNGRAFVFLSLMAILCWCFVVFCFASFIKARKARESGAAESDAAKAD